MSRSPPTTETHPTPRTNAIAVLPEAVRNRIAAGEVVERPASVVRELVDNALDAGAHRVDVEIEEGGLRLIRVADDGSGMASEDLPVAVERYATSKITDAEQIFGVRTLGFRGEALPSIGSVSMMRIASAQPSAERGAEIDVEGGRISDVRPAPPRPGTVVEVRNLFFNTPARRKFLRSPRSEGGEVSALLTRMALAWTDVAFRLVLDGKELFDLPPAARFTDRAAALLGSSLAESLRMGELRSEDGTTALVYLAPPNHHRPNRNGIHLFVGRRPIRDAGLIHAILEGYRGMLMTRQYPQAFLFLDFPKGAVDVNVHPQKAEVRFRDRDRVFGLVVRLVRETVSRRAEPPVPAVAVQPDVPLPTPTLSEKTSAPTSTVPATPVPRPTFASQTHTEDLWKGAGAATAGKTPTARVPLAPAPSYAARGTQVDAPGAYRLLGQALDLYLVLDTVSGLRLVDPHALHERILYNDLMARRGASFGDVQERLIPESVDLTPEESVLFESVRPELETLGYAFEEFGPRSVAVRAAPVVLERARVADVVRGALGKLEGDASAAPGRFREAVLAVLACRAAVKSGDALPKAEAEALLARWADGLDVDTCPHGRPTSVLITSAELERLFGRTR